MTVNSPGFHYEGAEKTLEVHFSPSDQTGLTLRDLSRASWDSILDVAKCKILSRISNSALDCYVLSESSLFVYADRVFLKTCGMTTLLSCLKPLIDVVKQQLGSELEWLRFSRKNFVFPQDQHFPHTCFDQETHFCLETLFPTSASSAHVLGDLLSDHWNVLYLDQKLPRTRQVKENIVNFMMYGIDPVVAQSFYPAAGAGETQVEARSRVFREAKFELLFDVADASFQMDSFQFAPCGFSLNAIVGEHYYVTIHVTPETSFSYASFETNMPQKDDNYARLLETVLAVFSPKTCTVGLFSDSNHQACFECREDYGYRRISHESARIQNLFFAEMSSFQRV